LCIFTVVQSAASAARERADVAEKQLAAALVRTGGSSSGVDSASAQAALEREAAEREAELVRLQNEITSARDEATKVCIHCLYSRHSCLVCLVAAVKAKFLCLVPCKQLR
jgi:hypothetical protein